MKIFFDFVISQKKLLLGICIGAWLVAFPSGVLIENGDFVKGRPELCATALYALGEYPKECSGYYRSAVNQSWLIGLGVPTVFILALQFVKTKKK
jgi:hypothetical protein